MSSGGVSSAAHLVSRLRGYLSVLVLWLGRFGQPYMLTMRGASMFELVNCMDLCLADSFEDIGLLIVAFTVRFPFNSSTVSSISE